MFLKSQYITHWILPIVCIIVGGLLLVACGDSHADEAGPLDELLPITVGGTEADETFVTRAAVNLGRDFVLYGYKAVNGDFVNVFNGYRIVYQANSAGTSEDNTHNYGYVGVTGQSIKYWDFGASQYRFWGCTGTTPAFTEQGVTLQTDVQLLAAEPTPNEGVLFSKLYLRKPVTSEVVQLQFLRPNAKVRIQFYSADPIEKDKTYEISQISFAPSSDVALPLVKKIYASGILTVRYPLAMEQEVEQFEIKPNTSGTSYDALAFRNVTLGTDNYASDKAVTAEIDFGSSSKQYYYYPLPMAELNPAFVLTAMIDGEVKTAAVPAAYMHWLPNHIYTYIYKVTEAGKKIEFFDVKIDPWKYGGSQNEEWQNW